MTYDSVCLGLQILGNCDYDPANPRVYFNIGQLVSVLALFLAFSQLITKPIVIFRFKAGRINKVIIFLMFGVAILFVFVAMILPFVPGQAPPLIGYPVFWEFLAGALFVILSAILIYKSFHKPVFNRRNSEAFLLASGVIIARGNDDDLRELADEIRDSIKPLFEECRLYYDGDAKISKARGTEYSVRQSTKIAFEILDLWSDKILCKNIACKSPGTAIEIIHQLKINYYYNSGGYALSQQMIHQALTNPDSILMREEKYSGLGFYNQFRYAVFGNWQFVNSRYRPLEAWNSYYKSTVTDWQVAKYCDCFETAFEAYFVEQKYLDTASLSVGLDHLTTIVQTQAWHIRHIEKQDLDNSVEIKIIGAVAYGLGKIIDIVGKHQGKIPEYTFQEEGYVQSRDKSIYGVIAFGIYEYYEKLAMALRHDDAMRFYAITIWLKVFKIGVVRSKIEIEVGGRLILHLKNKVGENLDSEVRFYPAITRLLITLFGILESEKKEDMNIEQKFRAEFIQCLKQDYPKIALKDPEFAADLLPEEVLYDSVNNELHRRRRRREGQVLKLITPEV